MKHMLLLTASLVGIVGLACSSGSDRDQHCDRYINAIRYGVDSTNPDAISLAIDRLNVLWFEAYEAGDTAFADAIDDFLVGTTEFDNTLYWAATDRLDELCGWK